VGKQINCGVPGKVSNFLDDLDLQVPKAFQYTANDVERLDGSSDSPHPSLFELGSFHDFCADAA
jgi:hypothetical protein